MPLNAYKTNASTGIPKQIQASNISELLAASEKGILLVQTTPNIPSSPSVVTFSDIEAANDFTQTFTKEVDPVNGGYRVQSIAYSSASLGASFQESFAYDVNGEIDTITRVKL